MKKFLLIFGFFSLLTIAITWPLITNLNHLIIDRVDGLLITWFLNWTIAHPLNYNANIFYPYTKTLAYSETMLPQAFLVSPIILMFKEPLLAFNINFLLGFILTGVATYYLTFHLTKRHPAALLASILLTYSTIHLNYMAHLQLFNLYPVLLAILFLLRKNQKLFILFFIVSSLTTVLFFYFLIIFALWQKKFVWLIIAVMLTIPFLIPYFLVSNEFNYRRPITDAINFSLQIPDLTNVSVTSRLSFLIPQLPNSTPAYFGAVLLGLIIVMVTALLFSNKVNSSSKDRFLRFFLFSSLFSFILALGPALHIFRSTIHVGPIPAIPLPYSILYYLLPGFSGLRTPSRWILLTAICLVIAIAVRFAKKITWPWAITLSTLVILEINFPFKYTPISAVANFPPEQIWLKNNYTEVPMIQFPIYGWFDGDKVGEETLREYYSTYHWHPMFNGYSGFSPKKWEETVKWLQKAFPNKESLAFLHGLGIKLVLVPSSWDMIPAKNELELVASFPKTNVYAFKSRSKN